MIYVFTILALIYLYAVSGIFRSVAKDILDEETKAGPVLTELSFILLALVLPLLIVALIIDGVFFSTKNSSGK